MELTIQPTELFFDESRLLNFFLVFAACEKHVILLMFWLVSLVGNLSEIRRIACSRAAARGNGQREKWAELRSARRRFRGCGGHFW